VGTADKWSRCKKSIKTVDVVKLIRAKEVQKLLTQIEKTEENIKKTIHAITHQTMKGLEEIHKKAKSFDAVMSKLRTELTAALIAADRESGE
jgi:hypothetical protein